MLEFFRKLFATDFMPHGMCFLWNPAVLWLNVISDSLIAASYYAIPFLLFYFVKRRRDIEFKGIFVAFGVFILACGSTHLLGAVTVWQPVYRLDGLVKAVTAVASISTFVMLIPLMPMLLRLPSPAELSKVNRKLESEIKERRAAEEEVQKANSQLELRVTQRTAELAQSESMFRQLADAIPQMVWVAGPNGFVEYLNRRWFEFTGATTEQSAGMAWQQSLHPDERAFAVNLWSNSIRTGAIFELECRLRASSGAYRWFLGRGTPGFGPKREIVKWFGTFTDIDDQKRSAESLKHVVEDLRREMERRRDVEDQLIQAQKMEAIGRLAGGVAHDFNNLLTVILGYNEMLRDQVTQDPEALDYASEVLHAAQRASALTNQLLAFSRRQVAVLRVLDLNEVVQHIEKMLRRIIGEDIELEIRLAPGLRPVKADPAHLDQVIMNLAVNSRDAMPGGGKLTIETANVELSEDYAGRHLDVQPGSYVLLAVTDTGSGMDEVTKSRLFEPFFTTKEKGKGTGLGLSIVYGIVKQNGGEILVYSELGRGTVFKIYLPVAQAPIEGLPAEVAEVEWKNATETILVVEDEDQVRSLTQTILSRRGYRILEAASGKEALRILREHKEPIHLLLTDIVMPEMSGVELAREVERTRPGMRVLYMSGYTDTGAANQGLLTSDMWFIEKPFTSAALHKKVREALNQA